MYSLYRSIAMVLLCVCLVQVAGAQFNVSGPGFLPDENGTNLDNPQGRKVESSVVSDSILISQTQAGQAWVRQMPAGTFLVQHTIVPSYAQANAYLQAHPNLKRARIVANYLPNQAALQFSVVSGPFGSLGDASAYADNPGVPQDPQIRSARFMKEHFSPDGVVSAVPKKVGPGTIIKDCAECPEMMTIPSGGFIMGSSAQEQALANAAGISPVLTIGEGPQHSVRVSSFAAGRYAVTKGEFAAFVLSSGYRTQAEQGDGCIMWTGKEWKKDAASNWRNVGFTQGDDHPVVCVSWNDAQAYIQWLSRISGKSYRLLSEAEREYAARGGTQTAFWWGDNITTSQANYNGNAPYNGSPTEGQHNRQATMPVNSFSANPFGLYNVHGNVWEWTQDCWHETYASAPIDGSAWTINCSGNFRVFRGGSWYFSPADLRSANRLRGIPDSRTNIIGFRLARDQ